MKKLILGIAGVLLVTELAMITRQVQARQKLITEFSALRPLASRPLKFTQIAPNSGATATISSAPAATPPDVTWAEATELARLQARLAMLKKRPPGVAEAMLIPATNAGRITPQQAMDTLTWAMQNRDLEVIQQFIVFDDDTPANREAFMANFSAEVQARYRTPEALLTAVNFSETLRDPPVMHQIINTQGFASGVQSVTAWTRYASGREMKSTLPFEETPRGWALASTSLNGPRAPIDWLRSRIDAATGDVLPLPPKK